MIGKRKVFGVVSGAGKAVVSWSEESGSAAAVEYRIRKFGPGRRVQKTRVFICI